MAPPSRVVEVGEDLPLLAEAPRHELAVYVSTDQLDRDFPAVLLVGPLAQVDRAHAAVVDLFEHAVGAEPAARPGRAGGQGGDLDERAGVGVVGEQDLHLPTQLRVPGAGPGEEVHALAGLLLQGAEEDVFDGLPTFRSHDGEKI